MLYNFCMLILEGWALIFSLVSLAIFIFIALWLLCLLIACYDNLHYWLFKKPTKIGDWLYEKLEGDN